MLELVSLHSCGTSLAAKSRRSRRSCPADLHSGENSSQGADRRSSEGKQGKEKKTGAAQLVEIRETVQEIRIPKFVEDEKPKTKAKDSKKTLFGGISDDDLLSYGVPTEWLADVRHANEDNYLLLADHLPSEAAEALLELATGGSPAMKPADAKIAPFEHPDALRRFRILSSVAELQQALDYPWEKWTVFLHPEQRELVERHYPGSARVCGSAGTGKTIVALHRAVHLARTNPDARVLLATFTNALANALQTKLKRLLGNEPRLGERIDVHSLDALGLRLHQSLIGKVKLASRESVVDLLREASTYVPDHKFRLQFLMTEWEQVVDAWQLPDWEAYRDVARLGRKTRLSEAQRKKLWSIFEKVRAGLTDRKVITNAAMFTAIADAVAKGKHPPYDFAVVDEAQDISVAQLRFFAAIGKQREDCALFRRRSRSTHFSAAFLVEESRRRHSWTFQEPACELSNLTSDQDARRSAAWAESE